MFVDGYALRQVLNYSYLTHERQRLISMLAFIFFNSPTVERRLHEDLLYRFTVYESKKAAFGPRSSHRNTSNLTQTPESRGCVRRRCVRLAKCQQSTSTISQCHSLQA